MESSIIILLSIAVVVLVVTVSLLIWCYVSQSDELRRKNDVIVREVRRNQELLRAST